MTKRILIISIALLALANVAYANYALNFDGVDDYVSLSGVSFSAVSAITIEGWVYPRSFNGSGSPDYNISNLAGYTNAYALVRMGDVGIANNQLQFVLFVGGSVYLLDSNTITLAAYTWYHFAAVFDGSTMSLYVNGSLANSKSCIGTFTSAGNFILGGQNNSARMLDGLMDEVRIWNTARTEAQIKANLYKEIEGYSTGLVAYYKMSDGSGTSLTDNSGNSNSNPGTITNGATWQASAGAFTGSGNALGFDGTNDYVSCGTGAALQITGSITVEAWIKATAWGANYWENTIVGKDGADVSGYVLRCGNNGMLSFTIGSSGWKEVVSGSVMTAGVWNHVAGTYDGSNLRIYINGSLQNTVPVSGSIANNTGELFIGQSLLGGRLFNGLIDEVRIWNTARTVTEITTNMSTELAGNETGLVAYYKMSDGSGTSLTDNSSNPGTITNGATWKASGAFPGPGKALDFDGSNDYVTIPDNAALDLTATYTIEAWIKPRSFNWLGGIVGKYQYGSTNGYSLSLAYDPPYSGIRFDYMTTANGILTLDKWQHIAAVNNGGTRKVYLNGVEQTLSASLTVYTVVANSDPVIIGKDFLVEAVTRYFNGEIDEVRIWNSARTPEQIRENMMNTLNGNEAGLAAYYRMDQSDGLTLYDMTANANNGTLTNMDNADWVSSTAFNIWIGSESSDWATAGNWSRNAVPTSTENVGIYKLNPSSYETAISGTQTVNSLYFSSGATPTLSSAFTVNGNLLLGKDINMNGNTITLGSSGSLVEDSYRLSGSGNITTTRSLSNITAQNVAGLGAVLTTTANMGSTTINRSHTAQTISGGSGILRYYDITPTTNTGLDATLVFNYNDSELNGLTEANLKLWKSTDSGTTWSNVGGTINTTNNTITLTGQDGFSRWTAALPSSPTATAPASGDGSSGSPYQISTLENLYWIAADSSRWASYYIQTADIDASATSTWNSGAGWTPIGNNTTKFTGSYDGNNKKISNLYINRNGTQYVGLFGFVDASSKYFKKIIIDGGTITGGGPTGAIAGAFFYGIMEDCSSSAAVTGTSNVGGIAGQLDSNGSTNGIIRRCSSSGNVNGSGQAGGLVGLNQANGDAGIHQSFATGNVDIATGEIAGGLVGYNGYASIRNSYSTGNVTGNSKIGGFVGYSVGVSSSYIGYNYSSGYVNASGVYKGGFIGFEHGVDKPTYQYNFWDTQTSGQATSQGTGETGKTTAEMKLMSTFTNWDFPTTWHIDESATSPANNGYPSLAWQGLTHQVAAPATYNTTISIAGSSGGSWSGGNPDTWTPSATGATVSVSDIQTKLNAGTSVIITTGSGAGEAGDITISSAISKTAGGAATLTLQSFRNIVVNSPISGSAGFPLNVVLSARGFAGATETTLGDVRINANIKSYGGSITIGGGDAAASGYAVASGTSSNVGGVIINVSYIIDATSDASGAADTNIPTILDGGHIKIRGKGNTTATQCNWGIQIRTGSIITGGNRTIELVGYGGNSVNNFWGVASAGVSIEYNTYIKANNGNITITGYAGTGYDRYGIVSADVPTNNFIGTNGTLTLSGDSLLIRDGNLKVQGGSAGIDINAPIIGCQTGSGCAASTLIASGAGDLRLHDNAEAWSATNTYPTSTNNILTASTNSVIPQAITLSQALYAFGTINYTVTYNGNGNTGGTAPSAQTKTHGVDLPLATNSGSLVKSGSTFAGWNTQSDGLGTTYAAGVSYTANAPVTLYAKWTAQQPQYSLQFDGTAKYVEFGTNSPAYTDPITIEAWIKTTSIAAENNIVCWGYTGNTTNVQFRTNNGKLELGIDPYGIGWVSTASNSNVNTGNWTHVAAVKSGTTVELYINGVLNISGTNIRVPTVDRMLIGKYYNANNFFDGTIDDVRIWNVARTQTQISDNMNKELTGSEGGLVAYYKMNEGTGTSLGDSTANSRTGTLVGSPTWVAGQSLSEPAATYTITYDGNGNTGGTVPSAQTKIHDVNLTLATNSGNLVKTGSTFAGWNTASDSLGTTYAEGATYTANTSATLYAKWTAALPGNIIMGDGSGGGGGGDGSWKTAGVGGSGGGDNDNISGTTGDDVIFGDGSGGGGGGNFGSTISGGSGGGGSDTVNGGAGNDIIFGDGFGGGKYIFTYTTQWQYTPGHGGLGGGGGGGGAAGANAAPIDKTGKNGGVGGIGAGGGGGGGALSSFDIAGSGGSGGLHGDAGSNAATRTGGNGGTGVETAIAGTGGGYSAGGGGGGGGSGFGSSGNGGNGGIGNSTNATAGGAGNTTLYTYSGANSAITFLVTTIGLGNILSQYSGSNWAAYGAGNDSINGEAGSDELFGLGGNDIFIFELTEAGASDSDTIWDFNVSGTDVISLKNSGQPIDNATRDALLASQTVNGADRSIVFSGSGHQVVITIKNIGRNIVVSDFLNPTYTVTYNGNGNTGGTVPSAQTKTHDVALTLATNTGSLVKTGYTFDGWNTQADGLGTNYAAGANYINNASITLYAKWTPIYTVTLNARAWAGGGTVDSSNAPLTTTKTVNSGGTTTFSITPNTGSSVTVTGCGGTPLSGTSPNTYTYTTGNINANCTVTATFTSNSYTVTSSAGAGGSITPATRAVAHDGTTTFTITPNWGYELASLTYCGSPVTLPSLSGNIYTYTTSAVTGNCTLQAVFALKTYTVNGIATAHGKIDNLAQSTKTVSHGSTTTFTITPDSGYTINYVLGCNGSLSGDTYTTGNITGDCKVMAFFKTQ